MIFNTWQTATIPQCQACSNGYSLDMSTYTCLPCSLSLPNCVSCYSQSNYVYNPVVTTNSTPQAP
jgi:hypothetical protein